MDRSGGITMSLTRVGVGYENLEDSFSAGQRVARQALENGAIQRPDLVYAFCAGAVSHADFLRGLHSVLGSGCPVVGGSAIGVVTSEHLAYHGFPAAAAVIQSEAIQHAVIAVAGVDRGEERAGKALGQAFSSAPLTLLLIFYDSIREPATAANPPVLNASAPLLAGLEKGLAQPVPAFGAGLVGDYGFGSTCQFCGTSVGSQYLVGTGLSGQFYPYFRIMHGCTPLDGVYRTITRISGSVIYELDGKPVVPMIDDIFGTIDWRSEYPVDYLTIGVNYGEKYGEFKESEYVNRLIVGLSGDGEGICLFEPDLQAGTQIQFMLRDTERMLHSARDCSQDLLRQIEAEGRTPVFAMYIDCAGRTAEYSNTLQEEASEVQRLLNHFGIPFLGFYSGVEIAPLLNKSRGLDWTGVLLVLAED